MFDLSFCCCYACNLALFSARLSVGHFIGEDPLSLLSLGLLVILAADILNGRWLSHSAYSAFFSVSLQFTCVPLSLLFGASDHT